ncbi:MAG: hypothetical protein M3373_03315 [Gemmatimonadota bacterium]|nr:hypothetical protein [Gemmatimonadota bacterium]
MGEPFQFDNPRDERVYRRLALLGDGPAVFFEDACRIMASPERLATASHLVGHLLREVEANVRAVLYAQIAQPVLTMAAMPDDAGTQPGASRSKRATTTEGQNHLAQIRGILAALGIPNDSPTAVQWTNMAGSNAPKGLHRIAHRNALAAPRPIDAEFIREWDAVVKLLDDVLDRFEARYARVYERLDSLLGREAPSATDVKQLKEAVPNTARTYGYFFERLTYPSWLEPLAEAGFFEAPPPPEVNAERGTIAFPPWQQADYLARVADTHPKLVAKIVARAAATDNARVQAQLIGVALRLGAVHRATLFEVVERWLPTLTSYHWGDEAAQFVVALVNDGEIPSALRLAASLFDLPQPDPVTGQRPVREAEYRRAGRDVTWHLAEVATRITRALSAAAGVPIVTLLADALDYHVGRRKEDAEVTRAGTTDFSTLWAPTLRTTGGDAHPDDPRELFAQLTLDTAHAVVEQDAGVLSAILDLQRSHEPLVFRRLELALLTGLANVDAALGPATECLIDRVIMEESDAATEYVALLQAAFPRLPPDGQRQVLDALAEPPSFAWIKHPEYEALRRAAWQRDRLAVIADYLPTNARERLERLVAEYGPAERVCNGGPRVATWIGPGSPRTDEELRAMSVQELATYLSEWKAPAGFAEPSPEGLARRISATVVHDPERYALDAERFMGIDPTYVRALLDGLREASKADRQFRWHGVLALGAWVVAQPTPESDMVETPAMNRDPDWRWARKALSDLLGHGLSADEAGEIPFDARDRVWDLLSILANDVNPSPGYEARWRGSNMDPSTLALNTVRPEAVDAVIRYAFWVGRHLRGEAPLPRGFDDVPEAAALLAARLDPAQDTSLAVRAAIGKWLGGLTRFDPDWVRDHLPQLLPEVVEWRVFRDAVLGCLRSVGGPPSADAPGPGSCVPRGRAAHRRGP